MSRATESRKGFTLVELAVVIVIIGVLAAFGVPQFLKSVERSKAAEAFNYLSAVRSAQERFLAKNGSYWAGRLPPTARWPMTGKSGGMPASITDQLDINQTPPKYFSGDGVVGHQDRGNGEERCNRRHGGFALGKHPFPHWGQQQLRQVHGCLR